MTENDLKMYGEPPRPTLVIMDGGATGRVLEKKINDMPWLCRLGFHRWTLKEMFVGKLNGWKIFRCKRCPMERTEYEAERV